MSKGTGPKELYVKKIRNGTVIDHIFAGHALDVLKILGIDGREGHIVSAAMNVISKKQNKKDIVKVENRELKPGEVDKIALIAPSATISIIRDYEVAEKTILRAYLTLSLLSQGSVWKHRTPSGSGATTVSE